jgi:formylglycine-generating enzyme required for sulfatase activity
LGKYRYDYNETTGHFEWDQSQNTTVGRYQPNAWGFYDMHGNVAELCADVWVNSGYDGSDLVDPVRGGGTTGSVVSRGGSWINNARECRAASRGKSSPNAAELYTGLRLALVPERPEAE